MAQQNIDFGAFPNDPAADPIRAAFAKVQDNFTDLYSTVLSTGVTSVDVGAGLTQNRNTGNITLVARISSITITTGNGLYVGTTSTPTSNTATITNYNTPFTITLAPNISTGNANFTGITTTSNLAVGNYVTTALIPSSDITLDLGSDSRRWRDLYLSGNSLTIGTAKITTTGNTVQMPSVLVTGNVNAGAVTATYVSGTLTSPSQPNITTVGILDGLSVTGNIASGNLSLTGNVSAANMAITGVFSAPTIIGNVVTPAGGVTTAPGSSTQLLFNDAGNTNAISTVTYNANDNLLSIAGNMSGGNLTSSGSVAGASLAVTGNASVGNIGTSKLIASGNVEAGNVVTIGIISATGNVSGGNITTNGILTVTGNASLGNITAINKITGNVISVSGNIDSANLIASGILSVTGTANVGNIETPGSLTVTQNATISGTLTATNAALGNAVTANYFTGVITTASQPNVTSLGTIINLSMAGTGGITGGNLVAANYFTGVITTAAQPNVTSVGTLTTLSVAGNLTSNNIIGNTFTANFFNGDGSLITNVSGTSIVGTVASATAATTAGTLTTGNQPNITTAANLTSIGTLSSLSVGGIFNASSISSTDNISTTSYFVHSVNNSVAAAGATQGTATTLTKQINVVTSATASTADGIKLPSATAGMSITIINNASANIKIYPATGGTIESLSINGPFTVGAGGRLQLIATAPTQWYALTSIYA